jgi:hypothetical protein
MPFNTPQSRQESQRRRRAKEQRLYASLVPLMNDTKWREVLTTICRREIWFQVQLIDWKLDAFTPLQSPPHPGFFERAQNGFVDSIVGGGFHFREIQCVRCPAIVPGRLVRSIHDRPQDIDGLINELQHFGQIPTVITQDYLEIWGYDRSTNEVA